jgi:hypothetical protein
VGTLPVRRRGRRRGRHVRGSAHYFPHAASTWLLRLPEPLSVAAGDPLAAQEAPAEAQVSEEVRKEQIDSARDSTPLEGDRSADLHRAGERFQPFSRRDVDPRLVGCWLRIRGLRSNAPARERDGSRRLESRFWARAVEETGSAGAW